MTDQEWMEITARYFNAAPGSVLPARYVQLVKQALGADERAARWYGSRKIAAERARQAIREMMSPNCT